jgi:hypothetical protein
MQTCPWLRASLRDESREPTCGRASPSRVKASAQRWLAKAATLPGWFGWRALRDLLNAIPDSNDDFGLF